MLFFGNLHGWMGTAHGQPLVKLWWYMSFRFAKWFFLRIKDYHLWLNIIFFSHPATDTF